MVHLNVLLFVAVLVPSAALHSWHALGPKPNECRLPKEVSANLRKVPYHHPYDMLRNREPFTWLRWGDGDMFCAMNFGNRGRDSNGFSLNSDSKLCGKLRDQYRQYGADADSNLYVVLGTFFICEQQHPDTFTGVANFIAQDENRVRPHVFVDPFPRHAKDDLWYIHLFDHTEHIPPGSRPVMTFLRGQTVVLVGPSHLDELRSALNHTAFIDAENAGERAEEIEAQMVQESARHRGNAVFVLSAGIAGRVIGYDVWKQIGAKDTIIDTGSELDGLAGRPSRDYNRDMEANCRDFSHYMPEPVCNRVKTVH